MGPDDDAGKPAGKTVLEVLFSKHPEQRETSEEDFLECDELPALIDVDITSYHVMQAAKKVSGSSGISGFDSYQLQRLLLRYGKYSDDLRESFARATRNQQTQQLNGKK